MTPLNHIGVFVFILLIIILLVLFDDKVKRDYKFIDLLWSIPIISLFGWSIIEAFYWTFKIFF